MFGLLFQLKEKAQREQEAFNERLGVSTPKKMKRRKSTYVEQDTEMEEKIFSEPLQPPAKKRKESESTQTETDAEDLDIKKEIISSPLNSPSKQKSIAQSPSKQKAVSHSPNKQKPIPMTVIHTPLKDVERKKNKSISEASDSNIDQSDAFDDSTASVSKKKSKKKKKSKEISPPDDKPPDSLFKYFAQTIHTGKPHKAQKAFDKMTKKEKKQLNAEYNEKVESYVNRLKAYLATLDEKDAIAYVILIFNFY